MVRVNFRLRLIPETGLYEWVVTDGGTPNKAAPRMVTAEEVRDAIGDLRGHWHEVMCLGVRIEGRNAQRFRLAEYLELVINPPTYESE